MISRREWLRWAAGASAAIAIKGCSPSENSASAAPIAADAAVPPRALDLITRAVPSSGELLPVVGLGGANT